MCLENYYNKPYFKLKGLLNVEYFTLKELEKYVIGNKNEA